MRPIGFRRAAALVAMMMAAALMLPVAPAQADTAPLLFVSDVGNRVVALSTPTQLFPSYVFLGCQSDQPIVSWTFQLLDGSGALVRTIVPPVAEQECTPVRAAYAPFDGTDGAGHRLADGSYTMHVAATDSLGLTGTLDVPFEVDTRIPGYLLSPQAGAQLSGNVALNVFPAQSTNVERVDYALSGCGQTTATPGPPGVFSGVLNVGACPSGPQTLSTSVEWLDAYGETLFYGFDTPVVVGPTLQLITAPVVFGTPIVGERYATTTGTWSPRNNVSISFQWLSDGVPIPGAVSATYNPVGADVGNRLSVSVTASRTGYQSSTVVSGPSAVIGPAKARISVLYIDGTPQVGSTLLGYAGTSSRGPMTISLQWLSNGTAIPGATGQTYTPVPSDAGARIRLQATVSGPGYIPTTATTPATAPVAAS